MKRQIAGTVIPVVLGVAIATACFGAEPKPSPETGKVAAKEEKKQEASEAEQSQIGLKVSLFSPLFDKTPVATVNDEPILLEELKTALMGVHQQATEGKTGLKKDYLKVLNRIITTRLILAEAENMRLDEVPEIKTAVDAYRMDHLRDMLKARQLQDLKPDEKLVDQYYKAAVKEWKLRSLKFDKKEDADALVKDVKGGGNFDALANKLIDSHKAEGAKEGDYVRPKALLPYIANTVSAMKVGAVSGVLPIGPAFTVIKLEDVRYPAGDAQAREAAEKQAIESKRAEVLTKYNDALKKKYATVNEKLLKKLDFEAPKPGFNNLLKDKRVVVRIKGGDPITVADIAQGLAARFFHGVEGAIKEKNVNVAKPLVLRNLIYREAFVREAKRLGIDKSEQYLHDVREYRNSLVFGDFIKKVVAPDIKVTDDDIAAYYKEHIKNFTLPAMVKAEGLIFKKKNLAEDAVAKLRKGTDFGWVKNNAEGQIEKEKSEELLAFSGRLISLVTMPDGIRETLQDAKEGDVRLWASPDGYFYVLTVEKFVPATPSPLAEERKRISDLMFADKLNSSLDDWAEKLRKAYSVKIFIMGSGN